MYFQYNLKHIMNVTMFEMEIQQNILQTFLRMMN
jgi:hypothetical protein